MEPCAGCVKSRLDPNTLKPNAHIAGALGIRAVAVMLVIALCCPGAFPAKKKPVPAASQFAGVDAAIRTAIADHQIPGAVVLIGHNGRVVYRKAYGYRSLEPRREAMTLDTIFDIASLTKVVATTSCVMRLIQYGQVRANDPVARYLPEFAANGKADITVRQLLTHYSGLPEDLDLQTPWTGEQAALRMAFAEKPVYPPGSRFLYSDVNFIVLGALVERVSGMSLDKYAQVHFFEPLKMTRTRFQPPAFWIPKIAPTQYDEHGVMLRGVVHDPTARRMGGVAGHAGLFSTADDLSRFSAALLAGSKALSPLLVTKMSTPQQPPTATVLRGFGWDIDSPFSSNRGALLPVGSFGHTGFTGTSLWIDPATQTYIILLTNAVHPRGMGSAISLRSKVATATAAALNLNVSENDELRFKSITGYNETLTAARRLNSRNGTVKTGIDVLEQRNFSTIQVQPGTTKIGLLTNQTGVDSQGRRTIDVLAHAPGIVLTAIFAPEHGATGTLDTTKVGNSEDAATGVPVYSVYGTSDASRRPSPDVLKSLDAIVIDIQDAGVRFYTYNTTVGYFLEAAAKANVPVFVLDRPDVINGSFVQGPVGDPGRQDFITYHPALPVRHGMTIGELAKMFNTERGINARLQVVPMEGWFRGDWFDSTSLQWINPSPNLRSLTENTVYPGVGLVEGTNVSVGRGTETPFELLGAPWINGHDLATYLNERNIPGVRFVPVSFTPASSNYAGQLCGGVNILLLDRNTLDAPELGIELASALQHLYPAQYKIARMTEILVNQSVFDAIVAGQDPRRIAQDWNDALQQFLQTREKYLIYK